MNVNIEAKAAPLPLKVEKWDLNNYAQRADAIESIAITLVVKACGGFATFLTYATGAFWVRPSRIDRRTSAGKRYEVAREALIEAAREYDQARAALTGARDKSIS